MPPTAAGRKKREEIVREHMESENRHEFDVTLETFDHPRHELIALRWCAARPADSYFRSRERRRSLRIRPSVCSSGQ